jgi:hypothetical protein
MSYDFEFDFDSFGNVIMNDVDFEETEFDDADPYDMEWDDHYYDYADWNSDYLDDGCPIDDDYEDDDLFYEDQLHDYERKLRSRIANNETIYSSEIDMYSDLFKDVFGIRPHGLMGWLTEYENIIDDYAEARAKIEANRK